MSSPVNMDRLQQSADLPPSPGYGEYGPNWRQKVTYPDDNTDKFHCKKVSIFYEFLWQGLMPCSRRTLFLSVARNKC